MTPRAQAEALTAAIQRVRGAATAFTSNLYVGPGVVERWAARGALRIEEGDGFVLAFRRDQHFHHLYYAAASQQRLLEALRTGAWRRTTTASDLVGREDALRETMATFEAAGFRHHSSLVRLSRSRDPALPDAYSDPQVVHGVPGDAAAVHAFLARLLDPYTEQLPTTEDVEEAARDGHLLLVRRGEDLGGILIFETIGQTSILRYWFVNDRYRDQGIGARLIKTFFRLCASSPRILLWVIADNHDSIAKYGHYRFHPEGLVDHVMLHEGEGSP